MNPISSRRHTPLAFALFTLLLAACASDGALQQARDDLAKATQEMASLRLRLDALDAQAASQRQATSAHLLQVSSELTALTPKLDAIQAIQDHAKRINDRLDSLDSVIDALRERSTATDGTLSTLRDDLKRTQLQQAHIALGLERASAQIRAGNGRADDTTQTIHVLRDELKTITDKVGRLELAATQSSIMSKEALAASQHLAASTQSAIQSMTQQINSAIDWLQGSAKAAAEKSAQSTSPTEPRPAFAPEPGQAPATPQQTSPPPAHPVQTTEKEPAVPSTPSAPQASQPLPPRPPTPPPKQTAPRSAQSAHKIGPIPLDPDYTTYDKALTAFRERRYPDAIQLLSLYLSHSTPTRRTPIALLTLGRALQAVQSPNADEPLQTLITTYPHTDEAAAARQLLQSR